VKKLSAVDFLGSSMQLCILNFYTFKKALLIVLRYVSS